MDELYRINIEAILAQANLIAQLKDSEGTDNEKTIALRESMRGILGALQSIGVIPEAQAVEEDIALDRLTPIMAEVLRQ
ncbi:hypothetical protein BSK49_03805 [Paenibacillus odorifer]|uniref:hypothetical protein n=1 Tax=Paenibacillus odorifer TaxID=189426 RepID=UPI00096D6EB2|nr:hypothetical protein [Paenibacillus odorifer]OMD92412.1 hypothetical protein BSK49_03805 [Paenibacillus odorifer]